MKIAVILKRVPDTASLIKIGADGKSIAMEGLKFVLSPYDEHAVEQAMLIKEAETAKGAGMATGAAFSTGAGAAGTLAGALAAGAGAFSEESA